MKKIFVFLLLMVSFSFTSLFADQWDGFFEATGFPRKIIDNGKLVKGKIYEADVSYEIKNNDGIKGNFENTDTARIVITNKKGKTLSSKEFMTGSQLRTWARQNFTDIFSFVLGDNPQITKEKINELTSLASLVLLNKNLD